MKKCKQTRYRIDCFIEAALDHWLATGWGYEHPELGAVTADWDATKELLMECAFIVDRKLKRVVYVVTYRWPELGESRLAVATILDVASGTVRSARVEDA